MSLTACNKSQNTTEGYRQIVDTWVGENELNLIRKWGAPTKTYVVDDRKFIVYHRSRTVHQEGFSPTIYTTIIDDTLVTNSFGGSDSRDLAYSCITTFELFNKKIVSWKFSGNDCTAKPEKKLEKKNGQGTETSADGKKYVGQFKDGKFDGQGTYTTPAGIKYVGQFKDGKKHGQGTETSADGKKYVGQYKDDKFDGQGTFTSPDGFKYEGQWKDGIKHGQGTFTWPNGDIYEGQLNNKRDGQGTLTMTDGSKYVGQWKDGKKHGQGIFTSPDGSIRGGQWKDDEYLEEETPRD